jgi:hypothetical protein
MDATNECSIRFVWRLSVTTMLGYITWFVYSEFSSGPSWLGRVILTLVPARKSGNVVSRRVQVTWEHSRNFDETACHSRRDRPSSQTPKESRRHCSLVSFDIFKGGKYRLLYCHSLGMPFFPTLNVSFIYKGCSCRS